MTEPEPISATQFHTAEGVDDWRVLFDGARSFWRIDDYAQGIALVAAVASAVAGLERQPDLDVRGHGVFVRTARSDGRIDRVDVEIAQRVTGAARGIALTPDPSSSR